VVWRITIDWLPDGDETRPEFVAHGRICHLDQEHGAERRSFHAYFEATEPPMKSNDPPYLLDDPRAVHHCVATAVVEDYPRLDGSIWDLVATMLVHAGRGWPGKET